MRKVSFVKAHGCGNDFLIISGAPADFEPAADFVRRICDRHYGVGADGVYFMTSAADADAEIKLYNADGGAAELSGNGTRCVAALLVADGRADNRVRIQTGAGLKSLKLLSRDAGVFRFEMCVGRVRVAPGPEGTLDIWLGNPQCALLVENFDFDWKARGRALEHHPHFPDGTNVDFVRPVDEHTIEARFWERGAGHTLASGTGSSASAAAAIHSGRAKSPVTVLTEGGELQVRWEPGEDLWLTGPAELVCRGEFYSTAERAETDD